MPVVTSSVVHSSTHVREAVIKFFDACVRELEVFLKRQVATSLQQIREKCLLRKPGMHHSFRKSFLRC